MPPTAYPQQPQMPADMFEATNDAVSAKLSKTIDGILSKEMQNVTLQSRLKVQEEVHGISTVCPEENPEMVAHSLYTMQQHLDRNPFKPIYDKLSPRSYIYDRDFRLRFLRCDLFDAKKAAQRLVNFTDIMEEYYGIEVLERPLLMSDLLTKTGTMGKDILACLKSGVIQLLPFRDRSGRPILVSHTSAIDWDAELRVSTGWSNFLLVK